MSSLEADCSTSHPEVWSLSRANVVLLNHLAQFLSFQQKLELLNKLWIPGNQHSGLSRSRCLEINLASTAAQRFKIFDLQLIHSALMASQTYELEFINHIDNTNNSGCLCLL